MSSAYIKVSPLGTGGMGSVELVLKRSGGFTRPFVLKRSLAGEDNQELFLEEARIAGSLGDPRLVSVIDAGHDADGAFLAMEYVEGANLAELLSALANTGAQLPVEVATFVAEQAALGLRAAHSATDLAGTPLRLVHRDISPDNILLGVGGIVKVADFGIALSRERAFQTEKNMLRGKPGYVAPEQLRLEPASPASDVFSLGVVLYEALTTTRLFPASRSGPADLDFARTRPAVSPTLAELIHSMLAEDPSLRPSSTRVADALADCIGSRPRAAEQLGQLLWSHFERRVTSTRTQLELARETPASRQGSGARRRTVFALATLLLASGVLSLMWINRDSATASPSGAERGESIDTPSEAPTPAGESATEQASRSPARKKPKLRKARRGKDERKRKGEPDGKKPQPWGWRE